MGFSAGFDDMMGDMQGVPMGGDFPAPPPGGAQGMGPGGFPGGPGAMDEMHMDGMMSPPYSAPGGGGSNFQGFFDGAGNM